MKHILVKLVCALSALQLTACAIGPLHGGEAARSNGKGRLELSLARGNAGYALKGSIGLSQNFDLGLQLETFSQGLRGKYAFINNQEGGFSAAIAAGIGTNWGGSHYYGDLIGSYFINKAWEPYLMGRFVHVKHDPIKFRDEEADASDDPDFVIEVEDYDYAQATLGLRIWPHAGWVITLEGSQLYSLSDGLEIGRDFLFFGSIGYRFQ